MLVATSTPTHVAKHPPSPTRNNPPPSRIHARQGSHRAEEIVRPRDTNHEIGNNPHDHEPAGHAEIRAAEMAVPRRRASRSRSAEDRQTLINDMGKIKLDLQNGNQEPHVKKQERSGLNKLCEKFSQKLRRISCMVVWTSELVRGGETTAPSLPQKESVNREPEPPRTSRQIDRSDSNIRRRKRDGAESRLHNEERQPRCRWTHSSKRGQRSPGPRNDGKVSWQTQQRARLPKGGAALVDAIDRGTDRGNHRDRPRKTKVGGSDRC